MDSLKGARSKSHSKSKQKKASPASSVKSEPTRNVAVKFPKRKPRSKQKAHPNLANGEGTPTTDLKARSKPRIKAEVKQLNKTAAADKTVVKIPKSSAEASSNWKSLTATIPDAQSIKPRSRRSRSGPHERNHKAEVLPLSLDQLPEVVVKPKELSVILNQLGFPAYAAEDGKCLTEGPLPLKYLKYTRALAIDCEMVGVGPRGTESAVARVALVNEEGACVYHKFVKPKLPVTDYRTAVSGIRPEDLKDGADVHAVMREISNMLHGHILVGHSVDCDLKVLFLSHPRRLIRDTVYYFKNGPRPKLSRLISDHLGVTIQSGEHNPIEDAQAVMKLYLKYKDQWEHSLKPRPAYTYQTFRPY